MPTIHVPNEIDEKIDELLVKAITELQIKITRTQVIELVFKKGFDKITVDDFRPKIGGLDLSVSGVTGWADPNYVDPRARKKRKKKIT